MTVFQSLSYFLLHAFFPNRCPYCGKVITYRAESCDDCARSVVLLEEAVIRPRYEKSLSALYAALPYHGIGKKAVWRLKFRKERQAAFPMALTLAKVLKREKAGKIDLIIPIPVSQKRLRERGFNQSEELARILSKELDVPLCKDGLQKIRHTPDQHTLSAVERAENLSGVFRVVRKKQLQNRRILLVDDVYTTGWTMHEAAAALRLAGAKEVIGAAFCRAFDDEDQVNSALLEDFLKEV